MFPAGRTYGWWRGVREFDGWDMLLSSLRSFVCVSVRLFVGLMVRNFGWLRRCVIESDQSINRSIVPMLSRLTRWEVVGSSQGASRAMAPTQLVKPIASLLTLVFVALHLSYVMVLAGLDRARGSVI